MCAFVCALVLSWAQIRFTPIPAHKAFLLIIKYYEKRRRRRDREIDERREKKNAIKRCGRRARQRNKCKTLRFAKKEKLFIYLLLAERRLRVAVFVSVLVLCIGRVVIFHHSVCALCSLRIYTNFSCLRFSLFVFFKISCRIFWAKRTRDTPHTELDPTRGIARKKILKFFFFC